MKPGLFHKEELTMKRKYSAWMSILAVSAFLFLPTLVTAEEPKDKVSCDEIKNPDDRNFCLATGIKKGKNYGYTKKNHDAYYCSLIRNRDRQNYCNGIINNTKNSCGLIVDKKLEEECNAHF